MANDKNDKKRVRDDKFTWKKGDVKIYKSYEEAVAAAKAEGKKIIKPKKKG